MTWRERAKKISECRSCQLPELPKAPFVSFGSEQKAANANFFHTVPKPAHRTVLHFRLSDYPPNAWASALGRPGESADAVASDLRARYGDKLAEVRT